MGEYKFVDYKPHIADRQIRQTMTRRANESYFTANVKIIDHSELWERVHVAVMQWDMLPDFFDVDAQRFVEGH